MKRVLHVVGGMDRAGAETMIMNLYRNINHEVLQFDFLYFKSKKCDYDDEIIKLGGKIHRIISKNPLDQYKKLVYFYKQHPEYTIVHSHTLLNSAIVLSAAKKAEIPHRIAHSHNTSNGSKNFLKRLYEKWAIKKIIKVGNLFFSCGKEASDYLFPNKESIIISNGIDIELFKNISLQNKNYINKEFNLTDEIKIIQVGRLEPVKNHQFSLELAEYLMDNNYNFKLYIIGQGPLIDKLEEMIRNKKLSNHVELLGVRSDVPQLMAGADIMLMPSLHEGFPVVLVEAQALGLPSIISTEISPEVDLGLGLVSFCSLKDDFKIWEEAIKKLLEKSLIHGDYLKILKDKGFDAVTNATELQKIYLSL